MNPTYCRRKLIGRSENDRHRDRKFEGANLGDVPAADRLALVESRYISPPRYAQSWHTPKCRCAPLAAIVVSTWSELRVLAAESAHRVTGVTSFILLADIGDQRLRTLHLNFEGGNQRVFRVNDNVSRFSLKFKANRKLHLCALPISVKSSTIQWGCCS